MSRRFMASRVCSGRQKNFANRPEYFSGSAGGASSTRLRKSSPS
jgi:hypothetical protein